MPFEGDDVPLVVGEAVISEPFGDPGAVIEGAFAVGVEHLLGEAFRFLVHGRIIRLRWAAVMVRVGVYVRPVAAFHAHHDRMTSDTRPAGVRGSRPVDVVPMPRRVAWLPRNQAGYPIPWFVADHNGVRDFRIASQQRHTAALREKLCWVCGDRTGAFSAFTIGPMCAVNRLSSEPPAHRACAVYSALVCPFLANPNMRRRPVGDDDPELVAPAGVPIMRNPGVAVVWVTRSYRVFRPEMGNAGVLCRIGDPTEVLWFAEGRPATAAEARAAMDTGLPALQEACQRDADPQASLVYLTAQFERALTLLPPPGRRLVL